VEPQAPQEVRRVISAQTANTLTDMMKPGGRSQHAVDTPEGAGYTIAGKTGTADMPTTRATISARRTRPRSLRARRRSPLIALVRIDSPKKEIYGGEVASPLFRKLADSSSSTTVSRQMSPSRAEAGDGADPAARDRGDRRQEPISSYPEPSPGLRRLEARAPGDLFVALKGERVDGHDYVVEALANGARGALVERMPDPAEWGQNGNGDAAPLVLVENTLLALQRLARYWRRSTLSRQRRDWLGGQGPPRKRWSRRCWPAASRC